MFRVAATRSSRMSRACWYRRATRMPWRKPYCGWLAMANCGARWEPKAGSVRRGSLISARWRRPILVSTGCCRPAADSRAGRPARQEQSEGQGDVGRERGQRLAEFALDAFEVFGRIAFEAQDDDRRGVR